MRYRRQRYRSSERKKLPPLAIVGIAVAAAILLVIVIGNILKATLDEEVLRKLSKTQDTAQTVERNPYLRSVEAVSYRFGEPVSSVGDADCVSIVLNGSDGKTYYLSPVTEAFSLSASAEAPVLEDTLLNLCATVSYVSGVYRPTAFPIDNADLFFAKTGLDCAVIREFLRAGGSEVLLYGLPTDQSRLNEVQSYLQAVTEIAGNRAVGASVSPDVLQTKSGALFLETLAKSCDFIALDLSTLAAEEVEQALSDYTYYIQSYRMRILSPIPLADMDYQILGE